MYPYICLTYALGNSTEATRLADTLVAYGFRCRVLNEASDPTSRTKTLSGAALVLALTSREAHRTETVAADLRRLPDRGRAPICISLEDNPIDERFCDRLNFDRKGRVERIPYPTGEAPDPQAVGLFIHRLFICHLIRIRDAFAPSHCRRDRFGRMIALAATALEGDRDAAYALGCAYERGDVLPVLEDEAAAWITRAAEAGLPDARLHLGELALTGWGVELDEARALSLFASVADGGDVRGEYRLALCYLNGAGVIPDPARAVSHLRRAARWGYAPALYRLGLLCRDGVGTAPNARFALECFYRACRCDAADTARQDTAAEASPSLEETTPLSPALEGARESGVILSDMLPEDKSDSPEATDAPALFCPPSVLYRSGRKAAAVTMRHMCHHIADRRKVPTLRSEAFAMARYEATHRPEHAWIGSLTRSSRVTVPGGGQASGHPILDMKATDLAMGVPFDPSDAALALARLLATGDATARLRPHPTRALVWYRYALRQGNTEALYCLADAYRHGRGTPADPRWATVLYRIAADWGDPRGQFSLAVAYEQGLGVDVDVSKAAHHYGQAAIAGYAPAQNNLGGCYEHGVGVARNILTAVEWYVRAAEAGLPEAMCRLGLCYETGRGVPTDPDRAFDLYRRAADLRHPYALWRAGICYDRREQYTEAVRCWQAAAEAGFADAAYAMATCYAAGHGVHRDLDRAISYLQDAAVGDCLQAVYRLAVCHTEGIGVARNRTRAISYLGRAVRLWHDRKSLYLADTAPTPTHAHTAVRAASDALYLLGLYTVEGWDPSTASVSAASRAERAHPLLSEAAELGHVGALIALGDLYAHGLLTGPQEANAALAARSYYERAVRISAARRGVPSPLRGDSIEDDPIADIPLLLSSAAETRTDGLLSSSADAIGLDASPALISLADEAIEQGKELAAKGDGSAATEAFRTAWRCYAAAVELGNADARIRMAECIYYGYGRASDPRAALRLLQTVEDTAGGRITAYLWLGDLWRIGAASSPEEADRAYCRGLACGYSAPVTDFGVGPYVLSQRRAARAVEDKEARAALLYRLATLRAVYPPRQANGDPAIAEQSAFAYLCESVLAGCSAAREDLARMYTYERRYSAATAPIDRRGGGPRRFSLLRRRPKRHTAGQGVLRGHAVWLSDYYTALWLEPIPFGYGLRSLAVPDHIPAHVTTPVTPLMMAEALNYVGDCFFYGKGLAHRPAAAVACYREVTGIDPSLQRGETPPECVTWAQYSLGWCLLHGEGTAQDAREAVRRLTAASRTHPEACYMLGECYEQGIGVDNADLPEAIKCYRRAARLGYPRADRKVRALERLLDRMAAEA